ncbi:hypothetical protein AeNC1_011666 [Aphanomyces euteiches]|nr:hypothetical protein AeNC1_011666 [Aphanomyces euteiches]
MVVDIYGGAGYVTLGLKRVTQFQDLLLYASGCVYMSRYVWFSYLGLRILSSVVKWRRWEATYADVDPAFLSISAYIYSGPIISILGTTPIMWLFYQMWSIFVPSALENEAIEAITGITTCNEIALTYVLLQ